jgi:type IV pilus assembly protein PilM
MALDFSNLGSLFKKNISPQPGSSGVIGVIGVDVGSSSIKIVQIHENRNRGVLDTYGELQLGPYEEIEIGKTTRLRIDRLIEAFIDILREASTGSQKISLALSYSSAFSTIITVPTDDFEKIDALVPVEARKYVPVPLSDVSIEWFPVSGKTERKTSKILIAATSNDALKRYKSMAHGADLTLISEEIEIFSTIRSVSAPDDGVVGIIDFGASATKFYLVNKGVLAKTHSVSMSGMALTNAVEKVLKINFSAAEERKRNEGLSIVADNPELEKEFTQILERGFREIYMVLKRYEEEENIRVERIILSGGGALLRGLVPYTQDLLSCPTKLADPFVKVAHPAFLEDVLKDAGPTFAVAVGAALNGLAKG